MTVTPPCDDATALPAPRAAQGGPRAPDAAVAPVPRRRAATQDPPWVRAALVSLALLFLGAFVVLPVAVILKEALSRGAAAYLAALADADALAAIRLTLLTAAVAVPLNTAFGLAAAWCVTRYRFRGRALLVALIDLPFGVSPVISGMVIALLFGARGLFGPWLAAHGLRVVFAVPGIVLATVFVTFPFVARELIPFMESRGTEEEEAAHVLGASGWQIFLRVTLPNVKWSLLYGVILCNARAMGEFGAVSVVSGHIRGETNTVPLQVEILYNEYAFSAAFAVASLLLLLAVATLVAKSALEWRTRAALAAARSGRESA
jgi:sulfate transport system permease protein